MNWRMKAWMMARRLSLSSEVLFLVWACWYSSQCCHFYQILFHRFDWPDWLFVPHHSGTSFSIPDKTSVSPHAAGHTPSRRQHFRSPVQPWTDSTGADKSDISSLTFLTATTFEAFSFHPSPCCCCRGCRSAPRSGDLPRKAAAAASAPCPCEHWIQSETSSSS